MEEGTETRWYCAGLSGIGMLTGYFVALSSSPVLINIMPIILGVVVGISAYILSKIDLENRNEKLKLKIWGVGFLSFSVSVVVASLLSIWLYGWFASSGSSDYEYKGIAYQDASSLVALRKKLQILGATESEQRQIVALALARFKDPETQITSYEKYISATYATAEQLLSAVQNTDKYTESEMDEVGIVELRLILQATLPVMNSWLTENGSEHALSRASMNDLVSSMRTVVVGVVDDYDELNQHKLRIVGKDDEILSVLFQLRAALQYDSANAYVVLDNTAPALFENLGVDELTRLLISEGGGGMAKDGSAAGGVFAHIGLSDGNEGGV